MSKKRFFVAFLFLNLIICTNKNAHASFKLNESMHEWALKKMTLWSAPGKSYFPDAKEEESEAIKRYKDIVSDVFAVAFDRSEEPLFKGPLGRIKTAALILSVANMESAFRKDVDYGIGSHAKGDGGQSWCLLQVRLGAASNGKTKNRISLNKDGYVIDSELNSWGGEDLVADRKKCIKAGLHIMRSSFIACSFLPTEEKLASYASGSCSLGKNASRVRVESAMKWLTLNPPPASDSDIIDIYNGKYQNDIVSVTN